VSNQTVRTKAWWVVRATVGYISIKTGAARKYNNWELDGGDNMDNGKHTTLNVYPSLDSIADFQWVSESKSNLAAGGRSMERRGRFGTPSNVETKSGHEHVPRSVFTSLCGIGCL